MKFQKDILIIDFEGLKDPIQIGAVLLDKETLEEKEHFLSYIHAELNGFVSPKSGITQEMIENAPTQAEVGKMVYSKFGADVFIGSFVQNLDLTHFKKIMAAAEIDFLESGTQFQKYDYHIIDLWPVAYIHLLKQGFTGGIGSEEIFQRFGAKPRGLHNALEDCRITADVLRKIVFEN